MTTRSATLQLRDYRTLHPIRDQVVVSPLTFAVPDLNMEVAGLSETEGGLLVASDIREHATSEAKKVPKLWVVLQAGPKAEETAGRPVRTGDVMLIDDHYRHDTEVPGGAGLVVMSVEAFVCCVGSFEVADDAVVGEEDAELVEAAN
jgi:hypothetical protein